MKTFIRVSFRQHY